MLDLMRCTGFWGAGLQQEGSRNREKVCVEAGLGEERREDIWIGGLGMDQRILVVKLRSCGSQGVDTRLC